jgi:hypothetical protein
LRAPSSIKSAAAIAAAALCVAAQPTLAEIDQEGNLRFSFAGKIRPRKLPRHETAPVAVTLAGEIRTTDGASPPQLRRIVLALNRRGLIDTRGLPTCRLDQIQPATSEEALSNCRRALVGEGRFRASVALPDQSPYPSNGMVLAFNGRRNGHSVIFAHIYGREPLPTSFVLPFVVSRRERGPFSAALTAHLPRIAAEWGFVKRVSLTLRREFRYRGRTHSYLSAGCPAPRGFGGAIFTFARASFGFEGGMNLSSTMARRCRARG